jgi:cathepsin L
MMIASSCCLVMKTQSAPPQNLPLIPLMDASETDDDVLRFHSATELELKWQSFKQDYGKTYIDETEEMIRKEIFAKNLKEIEAHNYLYSKGIKTYTMGVNQFSDLELVEFLKQMTCHSFRNVSENSEGSTFLLPSVNFQVPKQVDWRTKGAVTPIKNQGQCGSCWAFSSTGAMEGQNFRKSRKLISLSEQNLVDCSTKFGNAGCNGGWMDNAFKYVKANGGIDTEVSYPYEARDGVCRFNKMTIGGTCTGYVDIPKGSETSLQMAVATVGPVSVAIDAGHSSFQHYSSGVYSEPQCSSVSLDHGVLAVGYGTTSSGQDYWIVKNSWGTSWGMQGYILMTRNLNNQCGIASAASYPLV